MLQIVPMTFKEANSFVEQYHRHHRPAVGSKFCLGLSDGEKIVGVAIVGRTVARGEDQDWTVEVTRLCTDGTKNACSALYAGCRRAARALGYRRLITYTLPEEGGASLRGAGWDLVGKTRGGSWNTPSRPRVDMHPLQQKLKWEVSA